MTEIKKLFFADGTLLRRIFLMAIEFRRQLGATRQVARRRGLSAKNPWARDAGRVFKGYNKVRRARGPGTYSDHDLKTGMRLEQEAAARGLA